MTKMPPMQLLKTLANRLIPPVYRHAPPPVRSAEAAPTMLFSADDEARPSQRLLELAVKAIELATGEQACENARAWPGEPDRLLAALVRALRPRLVACFGAVPPPVLSAVLGRLPQHAHLVLFDSRPPDLADPRITHNAADPTDRAVFPHCRNVLEPAGLIMVSGHADGGFAEKVLTNLQALRFTAHPILVLDNIRRWEMLRCWRAITRPKLDLTSFGHWTGTGLIEL